jgi:uncharacterized protein with ParB-like and HNH nuclease domain
MIKSAQNKPVSELLSVDANWKFRIPRYQREYVWRRERWECLFDDLLDNPPGYFLGSMICINRSDDTMQVQELEVVDGQQRLTTLSLLYTALYFCLGQCDLLDDDIKHELFNLRYRLLFKGNKKTLRLELSQQGQNHADYRAILKDAEILKEAEVLANAGNRRLFKAYRYFINRLDELDDKGKRVFDPEKIQEFLSRINQSTMVKIEVGSHADAFTLFESLNNKGEPLSALDLIKNNLLSVLEKKKIGCIDENFTRWTRLLENLSEDYAVQERYLRQYYNAFKYKKEVAVPKVPLATRSNIIHIYDKLIDKNAESLLTDLLEKAKLYNKLIMPLSDGVPPKLAKQLLDLDRIGGTPAYTFLLYLIAEHPQSDLTGICEFLVKYFVRRNLTDTPPTRDLARLFIDVITAINEKTNKNNIEKVVREVLLKPGQFATEEVFESKLSGNIYDDNVAATRFILCRIEEENQTREKLTDLWERDDRENFIWTVEHIFPQGPNIPGAWIKMIAAGDETKAKEYRDKYVHKLGNLTISGYNSKLGNKSFLEKRDRKDSKGRYVGYKNGLFLNQTLKNKSSWMVTDIEERTKSLVKLALDLFKL